MIDPRCGEYVDREVASIRTEFGQSLGENLPTGHYDEERRATDTARVAQHSGTLNGLPLTELDRGGQNKIKNDQTLR